MKHFGETPIREKGKAKVMMYTTQCGQTADWDEVVRTTSIPRVTCHDCILALLTKYENKICLLEERYETLFPKKPVGEKLQ